MQQPERRRAGRSLAIDQLYKALTHLMRRRAELGASLHPELSLVGYTLLAEIEAAPGTRATDLAALFGLEKSTVSRQLNDLEMAGMLRRGVEETSRRGYTLVVTDAGKAALERETAIVREHLSEALTQWRVREIAALADMVNRFMEDLGVVEPADNQSVDDLTHPR
jgi:DNA-binding MarR family transcriptional regulator